MPHPSIVAREVRDGVVTHPLSGDVEFSSENIELAQAVADVFDERFPVTMQWVVDLLYSVPPAVRLQAEWVASLSVVQRLVRLGGNPAAIGEPYWLLGLPICIDHAAQGLSLRSRVSA